MRDRVRIRRTAPGEWTVTLPAFGFGSGETTHHPTHRAAIVWTDLRIRRPGSTDLTTETAWQPSDAVSPVPCWTPLTPQEAQA